MSLTISIDRHKWTDAVTQDDHVIILHADDHYNAERPFIRQIVNPNHDTIYVHDIIHELLKAKFHVDDEHCYLEAIQYDAEKKTVTLEFGC